MNKREPTERQIVQFILRSFDWSREELSSRILTDKIEEGVRIRKGTGKIRTFIRGTPFIMIFRNFMMITVYQEGSKENCSEENSNA